MDKKRNDKHFERWFGKQQSKASKNVNYTLCDKTGKRGYFSRDDAKIALRLRRAAGERMEKVRPFLCGYCGYHHLGGQGDLTREQHRAIHEADQTEGDSATESGDTE